MPKFRMFGFKCGFWVTLKTDKDAIRNGCTQGSFWALMCATRKAIMTDARNRLLQRIRARYGANPRCAQLTSQMRVTPLISKVKEDIEVEETDSDILKDYCWSTINGFKGVLHRWPADLAMKLQTKWRGQYLIRTWTTPSTHIDTNRCE